MDAAVAREDVEEVEGGTGGQEREMMNTRGRRGMRRLCINLVS